MLAHPLLVGARSTGPRVLLLVLERARRLCGVSTGALLAGLWLASAGCRVELPETRLDSDGNRLVRAPGTGELVLCDSSEKGARRLVTTSEGIVMFAGQALINQACSRGCHNSDAVGSERLGAPFKLDFELPTAGSNLSGLQQANFQARLRVNQRRVYDQRRTLRAQVERGFMPPAGIGDAFRGDLGLHYVDLVDGACAQGEALPRFDSDEAQAMLAIWLACGAPVVEQSSPEVPLATLTPSEGVPCAEIGEGQIGCLVSSCAGGFSVDPGDAVSFEVVFDEVLVPSCVVCHRKGGVRPQSPMDTPDVAYATLVEEPVDPACAGSSDRYAIPGDPERSYILHKMADPELGATASWCGAWMPFGQPPLEAATALMRAWILNGAPGPTE